MGTQRGYSSYALLTHQDLAWSSHPHHTPKVHARSTSTPANDIHNPTFCYMHCWLAFTLFSRADPITIRINEVRLTYAIVDKIKALPIVVMFEQWLGVFGRVGAIECTYLVTYNADKLDFLNQHTYITYIPTPCVVITTKRFMQAHMLCHGLDQSLIKTHHSYTTEIPLMKERLWLCNMGRLALSLDQATCRSISDRMIRRWTEAQMQAEQQTTQ